MFEINYSQLIQYEILDKLVTYIGSEHIYKCVVKNLHEVLNFIRHINVTNF